MGSGQPSSAVPRPIIQLPSFQEVRNAQRVAPPNLFQPDRLSSHPRDEPSSSTSAAVATSQPPFRGPQTVFPPSASVQQLAHHNTVRPAPQQSHAQPPQASTSYAPPPGRPPQFRPPYAVVSLTAAVPPPQLQVGVNMILVSKRQEGNPVLRYIGRNARWQYADIVPDYLLGPDACAIFLSLRFHLLKPDYIYMRIRELQRSFRLRVLLCHVDVDDVVKPLQEVTKAALMNDVTLLCAWSPEECARYLETLRVYESKPADAIQGRTEEDYLSRLNAAFTTVRGVNRTDVLTLGTTFQTAAKIMQADMEELSACAGIGPTKVRRLHDAFHQPFRRSLRTAPAQQQGGRGSQDVGGGEAPHGAGLALEVPLGNLSDEDDDDL